MPKIGAKVTPSGEIILSASLQFNTKLGKEYSIDRTLFSISTPSIPVFTIGIAQVLLDVGGSIGVYAKLHPLTIQGNLGIENVNLMNLDSAEITLDASVRTSAEAGVRFDAWLRITATAAIIYVSGRVGVGMDVGANANTGIQGTLKWSQAKGLSLTNSEAYMEFLLRAKAELYLQASAGIYYYIGRKSVWSKKFPLASKNFPNIGKMKASLPVSIENGTLKPVAITDLKVKENPLDDKAYAGKYLQSAVTGEKLEPRKIEPTEYQQALIEALWALPQISPLY